MGYEAETDKSYDEDNEIIYGLWELNPGEDDFKKYFEIFPNGEELGRRAIIARYGTLETNKDLKKDDSHLISLAQQARERLLHFIHSEEIKHADIRIVRGTEDDRLAIFEDAEFLMHELQDEYSDLIGKKSGEEAQAAYFFLSEPLYMMSSTDEPSNWILWALTGITEIDPFEPVFRLWNLNCQLGLDDKGIFVFQMDHLNDSVNNEQLNKLDQLIRKSRKDYYVKLQDPLNEAEIESLENSFSIKLPEEVKLLYKWKNGQSADASDAFVTNSMFLSLKEVLESRAELNEMIGTDFKIENWWNEAWLPLFDNGGGCYICYDMNGTFTGKKGQIIEYWKNDNDRPVISPDLHTFIQQLIGYYEQTDPSEFDEYFDISDRLEDGKQVFFVGEFKEKKTKKAWWKFGK